MNKLASMLWLGIAVIAALFLFSTKYQVQELEKRLEAVQQEILRDQEAIHVLKAEWSYLNRPARIADLAERHLGLAAIPSARITRLQDIPLRQDGGAKAHDEVPAVPASTASLTSARQTGAVSGTTAGAKPGANQ